MDQEFTKLKDIIADVLNVDPEEIRLDSTFSEDLGAASLDLYQIVVGLEEEFDIKVPTEIAEKVTTVAEALELIKGAGVQEQ